MCIGQSQLIVLSSISEQRRADFLKSADQDRILREAGIPTVVERVRLSVGRNVVRLGKLIAGPRGWTQEPIPGSPPALNLAR